MHSVLAPNLKRSWDSAFAFAYGKDQAQRNAVEDTSKAIVPVKPVLHVIILYVWAYNVELLSQIDDASQSNIVNLDEQIWTTSDEKNQNTHQSEADVVSEMIVDSETIMDPLAKKSLLSAFDVVGSSQSRKPNLPPRPPKRSISLPTYFSTLDNVAPLVTSSVRRSPRLNKLDGYQHCQYAPRKINKKSLGVSSSEQSNSIEYMPDLQGQDPVPIPLQVLQGWGIECGVTPEVITKEALLQDPNNDEN